MTVSEETRREEIRNESAVLRSRLNQAGVDICCAIVAGYTVVSIPPEYVASIIGARQRLYDLDCELAAMNGVPQPTPPLCLVPPPESEPPPE